MTKDIYKNIGESYGLDKHDRKDVKLGAVAVLQGECLTPEQRNELRMDTYREWRDLLSWEKKLLTDALMQWLRGRKCDKIIEKIENMEDKDRQRFLSEAIRTKKKSFPRSQTSPRPTNSEDGEDVKSIEDDTAENDSEARGGQMPISRVLNPE